MFLVKRNRFFLLSFLVACSLLGMGIYGYSLVSHSSAYSNEEATLFAEKILFLSIVLTTGYLAFTTGILVKSIRIDKEMDKIIQLNKYQDFSPKKSMEKLGALGEKITTLYNQLNELNEYKTRKIRALSSLNTFLVNNIDMPLLITDVKGSVIQATEQLEKFIDIKKSEIIGKDIEQTIKELSFENIVFELSKLHSALEKNTSKHTLTCYPIHNNRNQIVYIILVFEKKAIYQELWKEAGKTQNRVETGKKGRSLQSVLSRFFNTKS
jgi:transcriptional regulator with PAS, ATPase and Fis domain